MVEAAANRHKLAAILAADAAGYSRLMAFDESSTVAALDAARAVFRAKIESHRGRVVDMAGDSVLAVFETAAGAVSAALDVQQALETLAARVPADRRLRFRIGVHLGDVIEKADGSVYGDGVNIAARLEGLAQPGGITVSDAVQGAVGHRLPAAFEDLGDQQVKNIADPVRAFRVHAAALGNADMPPGASATTARRNRLLRWRWPAAIAVLALLLVGAAGLVAIQTRSAHDAAEPPLLSLAVLPFKSAAGATDEAFAEAFTRDLTSGLARGLLGSPVISSTALEALRGKQSNERTLGKELNVRYLVEGDVRHIGDRVVAAVRLVDAQNAVEVWSSRVEAADADLTTFAELLAVKSSIAVKGALYTAEQRRLATRPVRPDAPLELVFRGRYGAYDGTRAGATKAKELCDAALHADPNLAAAMVCKAEMIVEGLDQGPNPERGPLIREADDLTRRAVQIDPNDASNWRVRAEALRYQYQWDAALEANARAIQLDPSRVSNLDNRALYMSWMGRPEDVFPLIARASKISSANVGFDQRVACRAYLGLGRYEEAIASCERSATEDEYWTVRLYLAAAYAQKGLLAKAAVEKDKALHQKPEATIAWFGELAMQVTDNEKARQQYKTFIEPGLVKAGFPAK